MVTRKPAPQFFGWIAPQARPPAGWDLERAGWELCCGKQGCRSECRHVMVCDTRGLTPQERLALAESDRPAWRLILLGVEDPKERAELINRGCAEVLPASTGLHELQARASRVADMFGMLPRWRDTGPLTLDLFHRDARIGARWLSLHPREFGVLWRLADGPGEPVTRKQLLEDVWRLSHEPETNSVEVHISRLRSKLAMAGCEGLVETVPQGGYRLAEGSSFMLASRPAEGDALDHYLRELGWAKEDAE